MALSERLAYILDFNVAGAVKGLEKVGSTADKELGKAERKLDKISGNLTKFGAGAVAFAGVAGVALFKMGAGAAEAQANTAALRQVVDELSAVQIEKWAEDSARGVGLASKEAIAAATSFAGLGKIIGKSGPDLADFSTRLVGMAADMAAFKDVSPQQALEDLQSGFAGSTEVLRKYNIFLDEGSLKQAYFRETGEKVTGTLTAQQRIIATNSELYRQGADMIGQWGRESGEFAGQSATLRANLTNLSDNIGAGVLPMMTRMVGVASDAAGGLAKMDKATGGSVGKFAALGAAGVGLLGTLSLVAGQVIKMRDRFTDLGTDGTRSLNNMGKAAKGLGIALGVAAAALAVYQGAQAKNAKDVSEIAAGFAETARMTEEAAGAQVEQLVALGKVTGDLEPSIDQFVTGNIEAARRLLETGAAAKGGAEFLDMLTEAVEDEGAARERNTATLEEYGDAANVATGDVDAATVATEGNTAALEDNGETTEASARIAKEYADIQARKVVDAQEKAAAAAANLEKRYADLRAEVDRSLDSTFDYEEQTIRLRQQMEDLTVAQDDNETSKDDLRLQEIAAAESALALSEAYAEQQGAAAGSREGARLQKEELLRLAEKFPELRDEIALYIAMLDRIPGVKQTLITTSRGGSSGGGPRGGSDNRNVARKSGGPVPGPRDSAVPITAHGGEFVLSADVVDAVKRGGTTRGLGASGGSASATGSAPSGPLDLSDDTIRKLAEIMLAGARGVAASNDAALASQLRQGRRG